MSGDATGLFAWSISEKTRRPFPTTFSELARTGMMPLVVTWPAFGQSGSGIFIGPSVIAEEVKRQYGVELIGQTDAVTESFYAISVERKVKHPGIVAITEGARRELFTAL